MLYQVLDIQPIVDNARHCKINVKFGMDRLALIYSQDSYHYSFRLWCTYTYIHARDNAAGLEVGPKDTCFF